MTTSDQFCCVCFRNQVSLNSLSYKEDNEESYYIKLTTCIPELCVEGITEERFSCTNCSSEINLIYNFRKRCLKNLPFVLEYIKKLPPEKNIKEETMNIKNENNNQDEELSTDGEEIDEYSNEAIEMVKVELEDSIDENIETGNEICDNSNENQLFKNYDHGTDETLSNDRSITPEMEILEKHNIQLAIDVAKKRSPKRTKADGYTGPFKCDLCSKECPYWSQLVIHRRTHTGEKPFQCTICKKYFAKSHSLIRHTRTHTGEKPHECTVCHRRFLSSSNLTSHYKTHFEDKPYECPICKKTFKTLSCLLGHKRRHSDERPHKCPMCAMSFKDAGSLTRHKRTHTLERYHTCEICNKGFRDKSGLVKHKKTHEQIGDQNQVSTTTV